MRRDYKNIIELIFFYLGLYLTGYMVAYVLFSLF